MIRKGYVLVIGSLGVACFYGAMACSSDSGAGTAPLTPGGSGSGGSSAGATSVAGSSGSPFMTAGASGSGAGGTVTGAAGTAATAGSASGVAGAGGTGVAGASGASGAAGSSGSGGTPTAGAGGASGTGGSGGVVGTGGFPNGTPATCAKATPSPNGARPVECDYLLQSLDFEDMYSYASPAASIKITTYGKAFGQTAINNCSPICYAKNLTVGVDIVGGNDATTKGEVIAEYPATGGGLPITAADANRNILAWITFDGAAKPAFEIDTQLVLETATGVVPAVENKAFFKTGGNLNPFGPFSIANDFSYGNGSEFKYFSAIGGNGFPTMPANVTGIGFRITAKATAGQEWHGVVYIDHLQVRAPTPNNPQGQYPYGLQ
ncbi:MAG TPA: hypothetical protein VNG33_04560 [Polyangiaceae bacterium]|nr:hypothetical protein [Polyangiaceae bacterium]